MSAYNVSAIRASENSWIIQRAIDEVCTLPLTSSQAGSKSEFVVNVNNNKINNTKIYNMRIVTH